MKSNDVFIVKWTKENPETARQWKRMCRASECCGSRDCYTNACPLSELFGLPCIDMNLSKNEIEQIEPVIKKWAEEHPEPVYQTWAEWLAENVPGVDADSIYEGWQVLCNTQIPADIAEKLGLQPKEGLHGQMD